MSPREGLREVFERSLPQRYFEILRIVNGGRPAEGIPSPPSSPRNARAIAGAERRNARPFVALGEDRTRDGARVPRPHDLEEIVRADEIASGAWILRNASGSHSESEPAMWTAPIGTFFSSKIGLASTISPSIICSMHRA